MPEENGQRWDSCHHPKRVRCAGEPHRTDPLRARSNRRMRTKVVLTDLRPALQPEPGGVKELAVSSQADEVRVREAGQHGGPGEGIDRGANGKEHFVIVPSDVPACKSDCPGMRPQALHYGARAAPFGIVDPDARRCRGAQDPTGSPATWRTMSPSGRSCAAAGSRWPPSLRTCETRAWLWTKSG